MHNDELYHYGVLGMKWGVKKARKAAQKENVPGRERHSTGKHYDNVYKVYSKEKEKLNRAYKPRLEKLIEEYAKATHDPALMREYPEKNRRYLDDYYTDAIALGKKFEDRFNEATLKDINYKDVEKGKAYLKRKKAIIFDIDL